MMAADFDGLLNDVRAHGGVLTIAMSALRNMQGAGKLGARVVEEIERELAKRGLRHVPAVLPTSQNDPVRVFIASGQVGKLIEAALDVSPDSDEVLRRHVETNTEKLRMRIEEIARLADALGPSDPRFDMKRFSDDLCGEAD